MPTVIAVNASPRKGWNTDRIVREAARGAADAGAEVEVVDLYSIESFMGCRSCFACKTQKNLGKCVYKDGLADVLAKMRDADGIILGAPNYLSQPTAGFRALYERLIFQYLTYKSEFRSYNERRIPVLFAMTSNCPVERYDAMGYNEMMHGYAQTLETFVGPVTTLAIGNTQQVTPKAYEIFDWTMMDHEAKIARHEAIWDEELKRAYDAGAALLK